MVEWKCTVQREQTHAMHFDSFHIYIYIYRESHLLRISKSIFSRTENSLDACFFSLCSHFWMCMAMQLCRARKNTGQRAKGKDKDKGKGKGKGKYALSHTHIVIVPPWRQEHRTLGMGNGRVQHKVKNSTCYACDQDEVWLPTAHTRTNTNTTT